MNQAEFENLYNSIILNHESFNDLDDIEKTTLSERLEELVFYALKSRQHSISLFKQIVANEDAAANAINKLSKAIKQLRQFI